MFSTVSCFSAFRVFGAKWEICNLYSYFYFFPFSFGPDAPSSHWHYAAVLIDKDARIEIANWKRLVVFSIAGVAFENKKKPEIPGPS